jgi:hypothetical protein
MGEEPKGGVMDDQRIWGATKAVLDALSGLPLEERLMALQLAWIACAGWARNDALAYPGGFPAEQARQLVHLKNMASLVREATPDLELERLIQAGDTAGANAHLQRLWDELKGGAKSS